MIAQTVSGGSTVRAQLGNRVITVHVAYVEHTVVGIPLLASKVHQLNIQLLGLQGRDLVQIIQTDEEVSLKVTETRLIRGPIAVEVLLHTDSSLDDQPALSGDCHIAVHFDYIGAHLDLLDTALLGVQLLAG